MNDDPTSNLHPGLEVARYGKSHDGDRFVGFWLALVMEARQGRMRSVDRQARRILTRFWSGHDVQTARAAAGAQAINDQLRDAAQIYFMSCLTDPQYSSTMWRTSRIEPEKLWTKMARDAADTLAMLADSGGLVGDAAQLPTLLTDGFLEALAPHGAGELGDAVAGNPSAVRALEIARQA